MANERGARVEALQDGIDWMQLSVRLQARQVLHQIGMDTASKVEQYIYLEKLGFPRSECAVILESTENSLRVALAKRRGAKNGGKKDGE